MIFTGLADPLGVLLGPLNSSSLRKTLNMDFELGIVHGAV